MGHVPVLALAAAVVVLSGIIVACNAAANAPQQLTLLDTLLGPGTVDAVPSAYMTDLYKATEVAVALPPIPAGWQCTGPLLVTPALCAEYSSSAPVDIRMFQALLFVGNSSGPNVTHLLANLRFNMTAIRPTFTHVPACSTGGVVAMPNATDDTGTELTLALPLFSSVPFLRDTTTPVNQYYWLQVYGTGSLNYNSTTKSGNRVRWSLLAKNTATDGNLSLVPISRLRDRNNYYNHSWIAWTPVRQWEDIYGSANSTSMVRTRVVVNGCTRLDASSPLALSPSTRAATPVPLLVPTLTTTPNNPLVAPNGMSTGALVAIIIASIVLFCPLLVGVYAIVRCVRRRIRFANNKMTFRESIAQHSEPSSGDSLSLYYLRGASYPEHNEPEGKHGNAYKKRPLSSDEEASLVSLQSDTGSVSKPPIVRSSSSNSTSMVAPLHSKTFNHSTSNTWIPSDTVMFDVDVSDDSADASLRPKRKNSGVLISNEEDSDTRSGNGTPRHVVQVLDDDDDEEDNGRSDSSS